VALPSDPNRAEAVLRALRDQNAELRTQLADLRAKSAGGTQSSRGQTTTPPPVSQLEEPMPLNAADWEEQATIDYVRPKELEWNLPRHRERLRTFIAVGLLAALLFFIIASFVTIWTGKAGDMTMKDLLQIEFTPYLGIVGVAIGFYFGQRPTIQD
jgi:hypothetical protein